MEIIKQLVALGNTGAHTEGYVDRAKGKFVDFHRELTRLAS